MSNVYFKEELKEWAKCETRGKVLKLTLKSEISELRKKAKKTRNAYRQDFMGRPCCYLADAYDAAADLLKAKLDALGNG